MQSTFHAYPGPKAGKRVEVPAVHGLARTGLSQLGVSRDVRVKAVDAAKAHRKKPWDTNGEKITSCAELSYESYYDWSRFVDAAAACKGDDNCIVDVAFMPATPGIADRKLERRDGKVMSTQLDVMRSGSSIPKNDLFTYAGFFARAGSGGLLDETPEMKALSTALGIGNDYYKFGCAGTKCSATKFATEWDFHRELRKRNATVSHAEHEEYERRKAEFRELIALHAAAVAGEKRKWIDKRRAKTLELPFDLQTADPFDRYASMKGFAANALRDRSRLMRGIPAADRKVMQEIGIEVKAAQQGQRAGLAPTSMLAMPMPAVTSSTTLASAAPPIRPPQPLLTKCSRAKFTKVYETFAVGPISCRIGEFLREEWARKQAGHRSCLDLDNDDCDWSPKLFTARFLGDPPYTEPATRTERECLDWTADKFDVVRNDLTDAEGYIKEMRAAVSAARQALQPFDRPGTTGNKRYAMSTAENEHMGDKDWFAGGYSYDLGWSVEVMDKGPTGDVCQLEGRGHAKATLDAWLADKHINVADGGMDGIVNQDGEKKGEVTRWLSVFTMHLLPKETQHYSLVFDEAYADIGMTVPPQKPTFVVMAGPVPLTGSVWGALSYGFNFHFEGIAESPSCDVDDIRFGMQSKLTPWIAADGFAEVGVGVSGFASVGIRGMINLVTVALPVSVELIVAMKNISQQAQATLVFDAGMNLTLATLAGSISLYIEVLGFDEEWELFRWNGIGPAVIPLISPKLHAEMPLVGMK